MTSLQGVNDATSSGHNQTSSLREELQHTLLEYTSESLKHIDEVEKFCKSLREWRDNISKDLRHIKDIKVKSQKKNRMTLCSASSRHEELEEELAAVLKDTLGGLKELCCFLDAVEKLAVTSLHVFSENQVLHLPEGISREHVQAVITAAQRICPLLLEFKRDPEAFFLPKLHNVEVLSCWLEKYIQTTQKICEKFEKRPVGNFCQTDIHVDIHVNLSEDDMQRMLHHVNNLLQIRQDHNFRMVFLFQEKSCSCFIDEFNKRKPDMKQFLQKLEEIAVKFDTLNKGATISRVASSSVGVVGGVLSIVGLALTPLTFGVSVGLTVAGAGLGIARGVTSVVTTATEIGVKRKQLQEVSEAYQRFMKDVKSVQCCLDRIASEPVSITTPSRSDMAMKTCSILSGVNTIGAHICNIVDSVADCSELTIEMGEAVGEAAASVGLVTDALFLGVNVFSICKNSLSLAKGARSEVSQSIRARAKLWDAEVESLEKIHDLLHKGLSTSQDSKAFLSMPFYPEEEKKHRGTKSTANDMEDKEEVHMKDKQAHEEDEQAHEEDEQAHEEDEQSHEEDEQAHEEDEQAHEEDEQAHEEDEQSHEEDEQAHEEDEQAHEEDEQAHEEDEQAHEEDEQAHEEDEQAHEEDEQAHEEDEQAHEEDEQAHEEDEQEHEEDEQAHEEDEQAHEEDEQAHLEDKNGHVEDKQEPVEDRQAHMEDKQAQNKNESKQVQLEGKSKHTQEADKQEPAHVEDKRHVPHSRWIMKLSTILLNLLNPAGPYGGSVIRSYSL